jgi:3-hydroxyisobutyrate dehydrogenase-like beta-hydroxyacid dehydrogenase
MAEHVGFIGLGLMGEPMAANLVRAGFEVTVYNRSAAKAEAVVAAGAKRAASPGDVARPGGVVVTMVADDRALEEVAQAFGERLGAGGVHVSMSTVSPETAKRLAAWHADLGVDYVASPVFGRPPAAAAAKLWIVTSGRAAAKARVRSLLDAMGQGVFDFGESPGAANVVKLAGNFLIVSAIEALAEAQTLGEKHGIERKALADFLTQTIFACSVYQNYGGTLAARSHDQVGFQLRLGMKDVKLVLDAGERGGAPMPMASLVHDRLLAAIAKGRGDLDWTALALGVAEDAGLEP